MPIASLIPTSTSIVSLPTNAINPGGVFSGVIPTTGQRDVFTTIVEKGRGALLQNPVSDAINNLSSSVTRLTDAVTNSPCFTAGEITNINYALGGSGNASSLTQSISNFTLHTNTLSGLVSPGEDNPTPALETVLSVGRSLNNLNYAINSAENCLAFINNMTGLFSQEKLNGYLSQINGLLDRVNACLVSAADVISEVNSIAALIKSIVDADNNFFAQALERLRQYALAAMLDSIYNDPCGNFLLQTNVGKQALNNILSSSVDIIK